VEGWVDGEREWRRVESCGVSGDMVEESDCMAESGGGVAEGIGDGWGPIFFQLVAEPSCVGSDEIIASSTSFTSLFSSVFTSSVLPFLPFLASLSLAKYMMHIALTNPLA